jgi:hypothetical protein
MSFVAFGGGDLSATLRALVDRTIREIRELDNDYVCKSSPAELEEHFVSKTVVGEPRLDAADVAIVGQEGTKVDVSNDILRGGSLDGSPVYTKGTRLRLAIPYEGDAELLQLRPSTFSLHHPEIEFSGGQVILECHFLDDDPQPERVKAEIQSEVRSLDQNISNIRSQVAIHNASVRQRIQDALYHKRIDAEKAIGAIVALGIPIKLKDQPATYVIPARRRPAPVRLPPVAAGAYEPEPVLAEAEYQHILQIIKSMSLSMERTSRTFSSLDEEGIRDLFLVNLNGHYEGSASGETFNSAGKTDILIREGNRNVFIAECKFWHGREKFDEAVDQLLSYLSWRDSKAALLVFNRNKDSTAVVAKMHQAMTARPEHKKTVRMGDDPRYVFVKAADPGREILVTTMVFDIPNEVKLATK